MSPLDSRIQSLRLRMDDLLTKYTENHPEVRQINGLIGELEAELAPPPEPEQTGSAQTDKEDTGEKTNK